MRTSTLLLPALTGFLGGAAAVHWQNPTHVYAQDLDPLMLQSRNFVLLDRAGHKRGEWTIGSNGEPVIRMFRADGRLLWQTKIPGGQLVQEP